MIPCCMQVTYPGIAIIDTMTYDINNVINDMM